MTTPPRDLYLDLLVDCLANLIHGPHPADPWNDGLFRRGAVPGRDAASPAHTMVGILRLRNLRELAQQVIDEGVPGDFIETGVWRGGCCILMRGVLAANAEPDRRVFVADSFAGVPPPRPDLFPVDAGDTLHMLRSLAISADQVRANFDRYRLLDDRVVFVEGWFSDTLQHLSGERFALLRLDGDLYESTHVALEQLYPRLSPGGFVIIDDYGAIPQCQQAVIDYRDRHGIAAPMTEIDWTGVYWRKA